jgi:hypothetical protein
MKDVNKPNNVVFHKKKSQLVSKKKLYKVPMVLNVDFNN